MIDPFEYIDIEKRSVIEEEMFTIPVGEKVFGIDEGAFVGIIMGFIIASLF
ncbi:hypothetical protein KA005_65235 [bacterium]|nr:hypothetical protein [bacterium]